jgi:hypothetical protein
MKRGKQKKHKQPKAPTVTTNAPRQVKTEPDTKCQEPEYQEIVNQHKTVEKSRDSATGVWTVALTAIIAGIYFMQLNAMRDTVDVTRKASERADRAWVFIKPTDPLRITRDEGLGFKFRAINSGKTPARHLLIGMWVKVVPIDQTPDLSETGVRLIAEVGDLFPNILPDITPDIHALRQRSTTPRSSNTETWPLSETEYRDFDAGHSYVVAYVRATYDDIFHVKHLTRYCVHYAIPSASPPVGNCAAYNGEDDNEEP